MGTNLEYRNMEQKMKTLFLGAIILLLTMDLLDACAPPGKRCKTALTCKRMLRSIEDEDAMDFLEIEAFVICEEDGDDGLTWKEVSDCIESHKKDLAKLHGLQIPTKKDFDRYDVAPVDGILHFDEWKSVHDLE